MPVSPCTCAPVRPSAVVNAEIRVLAGRIGLTDEERRRLAGLWAEWREAVKAERDAA